MTQIIIPIDYAWATWTLTDVTDNTIYIQASVAGGTAVSPAYDAGEGYAWYWIERGEGYGTGITFEYRTADSSAGLATATYTEIVNMNVISLDDQKRYLQVRATFATIDQALYRVTLDYEYKTINKEMSFGTDGLKPTKDGKFKGRRIICSRCGLSGRKSNMKKQRGKYVHTAICYDKKLPKKRGG